MIAQNFSKVGHLVTGEEIIPAQHLILVQTSILNESESGESM